MAVTENRNRLFQIRAPTYSPTHPPTIRATSSFTKAKLEPTYPPLCKSTRLAVTHASPRFSRPYFSSFSPLSTLSLSFEIVRQTAKDRSNERNNPLEEGSGGGEALRTTRRKRRIAKCTFEIHPIEKYLNGGILVLRATRDYRGERFRSIQPLWEESTGSTRSIDFPARNKNYGGIYRVGKWIGIRDNCLIVFFDFNASRGIFRGITNEEKDRCRIIARS